MKIALNINEDNRILSACVVLPKGDYTGMPIVGDLPEGNIADYLYANGSYIYDPLPIPEQPDPQPTQEERIAALEKENAELKERNSFIEDCIAEMAMTLYA